MKRIACLALLLCLLLTSCALGGNDLNIYTTEPRPETTPHAVTDAPGTDGSASDVTTAEPIDVMIPEIPEEFKTYVAGYTFDPSDDTTTVLRRYVDRYAACGDYIYYGSKDMTSKQPAVLKCLNTKTGEVYIPCFDPVCTHDTLDCDLAYYMTHNFHSFGRYIVFAAMKKMEMNARNHIYLYDVTTGELRQRVFDKTGYDSGSSYISIIGDTLYNFAYVHSDNPDATGEQDKTLYRVNFLRYNISADKEETYFSSENTFKEYSFLLAHNGRIYYSQYFSESYETKIYSMLPDGSDVRDEPHYISGDYMVGDWAWNMVDDGKYVIRATNINTGETRDVITSESQELCFAMTDNYVYYAYLTYDGDKVVSSKLWRCDHNGENKTELITYEGSLRLMSIVGNYIYTTVTAPRYCLKRIHVETGEVLIIE